MPGKSHGWRRLIGCSPWDREELDTTEWLHFHALEKEMATHSSVLAWRIPGTGEPGGLPSMGLRRVGHDWSDAAAAAATHCLRKSSLEGNKNDSLKLSIRSKAALFEGPKPALAKPRDKELLFISVGLQATNLVVRSFGFIGAKTNEPFSEWFKELMGCFSIILVNKYFYHC